MYKLHRVLLPKLAINSTEKSDKNYILTFLIIRSIVTHEIGFS